MNINFYHRNYAMGQAKLGLGHKTLIMGILNVTPDSFSDGGKYNSVDLALIRALQMIEEGADIIDIGGESTRPGHHAVDEQEELERVIPIIKAIHDHAPHIPLSIDTYKAKVAQEALNAGAHIINDVWGFKHDPKMANVAAEYQCPIILMHNRKEHQYQNLMNDIKSDLLESVSIALDAGVSKENIILDPGIGFAKDYTENIQVMRALDELVNLGYPMLLATSRKRFIRTVLQVDVKGTLLGTAATVALGIAQGCQIVRVHDIAEIKQTVKMCDAIIYAEPDISVQE